MEYFLICTNPQCRHLINVEFVAQELDYSKLLLKTCPECGHPWSANCPFCCRTLESDLREIPHRCSHCGGALLPEPA